MALSQPRVVHVTPLRCPLWKSASPRRVHKIRATPKEHLLDLCTQAPDNGVTASEDLRSSIKDAFLALEKLNEVKKPATEDADKGALDGMWELAYTTTRAASAGKLGPFVGHVTQEVDVGKEYYINNVVFGPLTISLTAHWNVLDDVNWRVYFEDTYATLFGNEVFRRPFPPNRGGYWKMTYVDDDLRLLRTTGDRANTTEAPPGTEIREMVGDEKTADTEVDENLFVLTRITT